MLNVKAFANAATVVTAVFYVVCLVLSTIAPDALVGVANSWVHSLNLEVLKSTKPIDLGTGAWGLITISSLTWITTYATIALYNKLAKR